MNTRAIRCTAAVLTLGGCSCQQHTRSPRCECQQNRYLLELTYYPSLNAHATVRCDSRTGRAWYLRGNSWVEIKEAEELPLSRYAIHTYLTEDKKNWSIMRFDSRSGRAWWLIPNGTWARYSEKR